MVMMISKRNGESLKKHCRGVVSSLWRYSRTWSSVKRKKKKKLSVFSTGVYERTVICRVVVRLSVWRNLFVDIQTEKKGRRCMIEQGMLSVDHKTRLPASSSDPTRPSFFSFYSSRYLDSLGILSLTSLSSSPAFFQLFFRIFISIQNVRWVLAIESFDTSYNNDTEVDGEEFLFRSSPVCLRIGVFAWGVYAARERRSIDTPYGLLDIFVCLHVSTVRSQLVDVLVLLPRPALFCPSSL